MILKFLKFLCLILLLNSNFNNLFSQNLYYQNNSINIYTFLDDLANKEVINFNTSVKPYDNYLIAELLTVANEKREFLNKVEKRKLDFYLNEFNFYNQKSITNKFVIKKFSIESTTEKFKIRLFPIWGTTQFFKKNDYNWHYFGGAGFDSYIDGKWRMYANLVDNTYRYPLSDHKFLTNYSGGNYKDFLDNDHSEMRGGIAYSWNWGSIQIKKDNVIWGDNYNGSNILSGRSPSFVSIDYKLNLINTIEFNFMYGWLNSEIIDSNYSYFTTTNIMRHKYKQKNISANFFTLKLPRANYLSFGNSIVFSDIPFNPSYIIPFFLFKSIDHSINHNIDNQNSQIFFNLSSRSFKNLHLFTSIFIDEFKKDRIFDNKSSNFYSFKIGIKKNDLIFENLSAIFEYTQNSPMVYVHYAEAITFESNNYNLGHYLGDNAYEIFSSVKYNINYKTQVSFDYIKSNIGQKYQYDRNIIDPTSINFLEETILKNQIFSINFLRELTPNLVFKLSYSKTQYTSVNSSDFTNLQNYIPSFLHGDNRIVSLSLSLNY